MRYGGKSWTVALAIGALGTVFFLQIFSQSAAPPAPQTAAPRPVAPQAAAPRSTAPQPAAPRIGGKPDFNGIWQANNTANWDIQTHAARPMIGQPGLNANSTVLAAPVVGLGALGWVPAGLGVVEGNDIPYLPWAAARRKENLQRRS